MAHEDLIDDLAEEGTSVRLILKISRLLDEGEEAKQALAKRRENDVKRVQAYNRRKRSSALTAVEAIERPRESED